MVPEGGRSELPPVVESEPEVSVASVEVGLVLVSSMSLTLRKEAFFFSIFDDRLLTSVREGAKQR